MADKTAIIKHMNALVTPIEHVDVRGNKLLYLKIQGSNGEVVVNIGQKTYDGVAKILQPRETSTQLNILEPATRELDQTTGLFKNPKK